MDKMTLRILFSSKCDDNIPNFLNSVNKCYHFHKGVDDISSKKQMLRSEKIISPLK